MLPTTNISSDNLCDECKIKVSEMSKKIKPYHLINPAGIAKKFARAVCKDCKNRIRKEMKK